MHSAGQNWGLYADPVPAWVPKRPGQRVWREHYVAVEDGSAVRGGYALKPQEFLIRGRTEVVTDWQGPVSEGAYDRHYNTLGLRLVRDMLRRRPLLYSWGHGGYDQPMINMLRTLGWHLHSTPFCILVTKPFRFLRLNRYLRATPRRRLALDFLAWSGLGFLGLRTLHAFNRLRGGRIDRAEAEVVSEFGPWADALWDRCSARYACIGARDSKTLNVLLPREGWPAGIRLRVLRGGDTIGWAVVRDTPMKGDARFGDLRVGSVIDCFGLPEDAPAVIGAATRFLRTRGVDLVATNQAHPDWVRAFARNGYAVVPNKRVFALSPGLEKALAPLDETLKGLHLTIMDGHGPHGF
jgi:hypothetical protein